MILIIFIYREEYHGHLTYNIPASVGVTWPNIFEIMENNRNELHIEDYKISQKSLEQIFLSFGKIST